jgi:hypothetical protein
MVLMAHGKLMATAAHSADADQTTVRLRLPMGATVLADEEFEVLEPDTDARRPVECVRGRLPVPEPDAMAGAQ